MLNLHSTHISFYYKLRKKGTRVINFYTDFRSRLFHCFPFLLWSLCTHPWCGAWEVSWQFGWYCFGLNFNSWMKFPALRSGSLSMIHGSQGHHNSVFLMWTWPHCWLGSSQLYKVIHGILHLVLKMPLGFF